MTDYLPEALFILCLTHIGLAVLICRHCNRRLRRELDRKDAERKIEVKLVKQQSFAQGLTQGALRAAKLKADRLEEEYTKGWDAKTAQIGLNTELAHRTGNGTSEQRN